MDSASINWGSVADWVSGIGSLSAVVTALYLSRSAQRVRLRGYCGLRVILWQGHPPQDVLSVQVTNVGNRATIVNNISICTGWFKKRFAIITIVKDQYSVGVPYPLADGQEAHWGIPLDDEKSWLVDLCKDFIRTPWDVRTLRFQIHTTNGGHTSLRPELSLRNAMLVLIGAKVANPSLERTPDGAA